MGNNSHIQLPDRACTICNKVFTPNQGATHAIYCSKVCRTYAGNTKNRKETGDWAPGKVECMICGNFYHKMGTHIYYTHKMLSRKYREDYGFDVRRGQCSPELREKLADNFFQSGIEEEFIKSGASTRFKPGGKQGRYTRSDQTMDRLKTQNRKEAL